jgi:hypothetical protein
MSVPFVGNATSSFQSGMGGTPFIGEGDSAFSDPSMLPFIGGMFPNQRQEDFQKQMAAMTNAYARQRLLNQQQREQALRQQLSLFQPAQNQLQGMYGNGAVQPGALTPDSLFGGPRQ